MIKRIFAIGMLTATIFISCKDNQKQENLDSTNTEQTTSKDVVTQSLTNNDGETLEMSFDNSEGTATVNFKGETIDLKQERAASGIWYKNDQYELRGKGNDISLKKDGEVIFEHEDKKASVEFKNEKDDVLNVTFNNTAGTAKAYLNGGEQIDLEREKAASGIWYKNNQYELRGKGNDISLKKDGEVVFEHEDDKVNVEAKNDKGDVLTMTFNNTAGMVKAYLKGGEQIDLKQKKAASGIWYENDEYELRGKGDSYILIKDGETVFEN
ncbi:MliC family protein [Mesonia ostreae]|uniref:MliC family protein n=1 Tax=Mesonia ostreae TaxID=861110 RepID=A0ABU2KFS8_9FLAO|nr:MliC family protein [Mesonia ostreae]MDT0293572.1 MliC family protein [Mesonia ostreae]